jgi:hypothetical protein
MPPGGRGFRRGFPRRGTESLLPISRGRAANPQPRNEGHGHFGRAGPLRVIDLATGIEGTEGIKMPRGQERFIYGSRNRLIP